MPYLTQNLAHLEASSHKIFQTSQNFQTILQRILWRNKHKSHFLMFITNFLHLNKGFWLFWGSSKVIFVKNLTEFYQISLKTLPYLTDFSPQLMACMKYLHLISSYCGHTIIQLLTIEALNMMWYQPEKTNIDQGDFIHAINLWDRANFYGSYDKILRDFHKNRFGAHPKQ